MKGIFLLLGISLGIVVTSADDLVFVQAVWRHGDRSPTTTFPNDPYQEGNWTQGWGQLSPKGMLQHLNLGDKLRRRYITQTYKGFLTENYRNHEIYVRSTDVNRTLISAMSNMITMFPAKDGDYPDDPRWPTKWVPIPIHTINDDLDYTLNADLVCTRKTDLWNLVKQGPEYNKMLKDEKDLFDLLTKKTGMTVTPDNLWIVFDALFIEKDNNRAIDDAFWNQKWKDTGKTLYAHINDTNNIVDLWDNGLNLTANGDIDFSIQIPTIRGGSLLWSMIGHIDQKINCMGVTDFTAHPECQFFSTLKYYAYSAHDTTIAALFSALGFHKTNWNEDGYPHYSSCVTVELWQKADKTYYIKFMYLPLAKGDVVEDVTDTITGCSSPCTLEKLKKRSEPYIPHPDPATLCNSPLNGGNTISTTDSSAQNPTTSNAHTAVPTLLSLLVVTLVKLY